MFCQLLRLYGDSDEVKKEPYDKWNYTSENYDVPNSSLTVKESTKLLVHLGKKIQTQYD